MVIPVENVSLKVYNYICSLSDDDLPFKAIYVEYLKSLEVRKSQNIQPTELVDNLYEEKFWMRDSIALKRWEMLVDIALKTHKPNKRVAKTAPLEGTSQAMIGDGNGLELPKMKSSSADAGKAHEDSGDNTDDMLAAAALRVKKSKKRRSKKSIDSVVVAPVMNEPYKLVLAPIRSSSSLEVLPHISQAFATHYEAPPHQYETAYNPYDAPPSAHHYNMGRPAEHPQHPHPYYPAPNPDHNIIDHRPYQPYNHYVTEQSPYHVEQTQYLADQSQYRNDLKRPIADTEEGPHKKLREDGQPYP